MTAEERRWHEEYENLGPRTRSAVDDAFKTVVDRLREDNLPAAMDDRAEALIAAITKYTVESI